MEKKILSKLEENAYLIFAGVVTVCALYVRYIFRDYESADYTLFLSEWYDVIKSGGGLKALDSQVGDYNVLYQFLIALMTYIPIKPLYAYKILSVIFDFLLAVSSSLLVTEVTKCDGGRKHMNKVFAYSAVIMSPVVFINSAWWGQCDSIYTFFVIFALLCFVRERYIRAFVLLGFAFSFKLQTIIIMPLFLFIYVYKKNHSILHYLIIPAVMTVTALPCVAAGRRISDIFSIYISQAGDSNQMTAWYPNIWGILTENFYDYEGNDAYAKTAIICTFLILLFHMMYWLAKKINITGENIIYMAYIITSTCVISLPAMHERYGYMSELLLLMTVFGCKKTLPSVVITWLVIVECYLQVLLEKETGSMFTMLSIINVAVYIYNIAVLGRQLVKSSEV